MLAVQEPPEQWFNTNKAEQLIANLASRSARSGSRKMDNRPLPPRATPDLEQKRRDSMLAARGRDVRRERTFVGSECAVCEEPLEHILRGERILQLSCGHVTHQACFYEYTKELDTDAPQCPTCSAPLGLDPSRGVAADFDNLHRMIRAAVTPDIRHDDYRPMTSDAAWDPESLLRNEKTLPSIKYEPRVVDRNTTQSERQKSAHDWRWIAQASQHAQSTPGLIRKQDSDHHSVETSATQPRKQNTNLVPAPLVTVRSEYPTLSRSKQHQSLTCLVTVEVLPTHWQAECQEQAKKTPKKKKSKSDSARTAEADETKHLDSLKEELFAKVENWHGLDCTRFGKLLLQGTMRVGKDKQSWQELECYLFTQMLICVKEKRAAHTNQEWTATNGAQSQTKYALKGSILIKRHLQHVQYIADQQMLSLSLSVVELPYFHLQFKDRKQMDIWRTALSDVEKSDPAESFDYDPDELDDDHTEDGRMHRRRVSTLRSSSHVADRSTTTAATDYTSWTDRQDESIQSTIHVPVDFVVVVPVSSTTQGLKNNLLQDALRFLIANLGTNDRMALVTFGSAAGGVALVGMNTKDWSGWSKALEAIHPEVGKPQRAEVVDGANVAMDVLMQRKHCNPLSSILLISDSATADEESVDFVISRAEAAKITIQSFGLGLTHDPDTMMELSTRTKGCYTYVKDWMMLRECLAGCLGALQSISHQNVKVKLHLPDGSPAKFVKISGALQITKRATGRDAEACLGNLRFGDKRDILVQLTIPPDSSLAESPTSDPWEHIISNLEALGDTTDSEELRGFSVEEMPLLQADLTWGDVLRDGSLSQLPRQSLLAITVLPTIKKGGQPQTPPIPPHPSVVQRRMELLTSDMLGRALALVAKDQHDRANHLLVETRSILQGLSKGGLPPLPQNERASKVASGTSSPTTTNMPSPNRRTPTPPRSDVFAPGAGIDQQIISALDYDLVSSLEYILHPQVFNRDSRKAVLQSVGVISSQRGLTHRTPAETLWASRIPGIQRLLSNSQNWRQHSELVNASDI